MQEATPDKDYNHLYISPVDVDSEVESGVLRYTLSSEPHLFSGGHFSVELLTLDSEIKSPVASLCYLSFC